MARVVCDTSFLVHLATARIGNLDRLDETGPVTFAVPEAVLDELAGLARDPARRGAAEAAMRYASGLETVPVRGAPADSALVEHARESRCIIGTMDRALKRLVKEAGGSVMSFHGDRLVLEPQVSPRGTRPG